MQLQCCGVDGPRDWINQIPFPLSCCDDTQLSICQLSNAYKEGCFSKLEMRIQNSATVLIGVGIGIAFVEASKILLHNISIRHVKSVLCWYFILLR